MPKTDKILPKKTPAAMPQALEMIPFTVSIEKGIAGRLYKMKKAKGLPHEQDLIRLAAVEMLERGGF